MTAELALLIFIYAGLVMGVFLKPDTGMAMAFKNTVPALSARIERNVATGHGFWSPTQGSAKSLGSRGWEEP